MVDAHAEFERLVRELEASPNANTVQIEHRRGWLQVQRTWSAAGPGVVAWSSDRVAVAHDPATGKWTLTEAWDHGSTESEAARGERPVRDFDAPGPAIALLKERFAL